MNSVKKYFTGIIGVILLVAIDQLTKYQALHQLKNTAGIDIFPGVFRLEYLENHGAAFGILQGQRMILLIVTILISVLLSYLYYRLPRKNRYIPMQVVLILLVSGAIGNMIDRIGRTFVIDFFYFNLIDFPIFNVADCYVVVGVTLAMLCILFYYREEDFAFLDKKNTKDPC